MKNFGLRTRVFIGITIPVVLLIGIAVVGILSVDKIGTLYDDVANVNLPVVINLEELKIAGLRLVSSSNEYLLNAKLGLEEVDEDETELDEIAASRSAYDAVFTAYKGILATGASAEEVELLNDIETSGQTLMNMATIIVELDINSSTAELAEQRTALEDAETEFLAAVDSALEVEGWELAINQNSVTESVNAAKLSSILLTTLAGVTTLGLAIYILWSVLRPLQRLMTVANSLKSGDLSARSDLKSGDEFGQFAASFNAMADAVQDRDRKVQTQLEETTAARERAERSEKVKAAFLASMSHELRTPLNSVINFTRFVVEGDTGPVNEQQVELLNEVVNSGKHLLNLINDVLDMSKIEANSINLFVEDNVDVKAIITSAMTTARALVNDKPVELVTEVNDNLPRIRADRQRILQILLNIVSNACKFTDTGHIRLKAYTVDDEVLISVEDTGHGIAPEDHDRVFEAFKQTRSGLREGGGTGLGMPIARSLVEAHGGHMWLESVVGQGTTFFVALPIKADILTPTLQ